jgi:hypothetical protein
LPSVPTYALAVVKPLLGRLWFAGTAVVVAIGLVVQLVATARLHSGFFDSRAGRIVNMFCFFTIQSNIIVLVTCALLAAGSARRPLWFWVLRLDGVVCITVTFVVFHVALADLHDLQGLAKVADFLLHTASPLLCVIGWLVFGPRGRTSWRTVLLAAIFPVAWLVFALVRGPLVGDYYPTRSSTSGRTATQGPAQLRRGGRPVPRPGRRGPPARPAAGRPARDPSQPGLRPLTGPLPPCIVAANRAMSVAPTRQQPPTYRAPAVTQRPRRPGRRRPRPRPSCGWTRPSSRHCWDRRWRACRSRRRPA